MTLRAVLLTGTMLLGAATFAHADSGTHQFDIRAQPLGSALLDLGGQSGLSVVMQAQATDGLQARGVKGTLSTRDALQQLLAGTGLLFEFPDANSVRIYRPQQNSSLALPSLASVTASAKPLRAPAPFEAPEELVVTGTRIRGAAPVGNELVTISRDDIERSGYGSLDQVLQALPQNATGGGIAQNYNSNNRIVGASVNLRGLGPDATLILVNGRRLPGARNTGDAADILQIPVAAIERIEIVPDGASAIYGSDAVGGVVNFRLKTNYEGAETSLRFGSVTSGGLKETQVGQTIGHAWDGGSVLFTYQFSNRDRLNGRDRSYFTSDLRRFGGTDYRLPYPVPGNLTVAGVGSFTVPPGQNGTALRASQLSPGTALADFQDGIDIFPAQQSHNVALTARQHLTDHVEAFADLLVSRREFHFISARQITSFVVPATNPFRVAGGLFPGATITENYDLTNDIGLRPQRGATRNYNGVTGVKFDVGTWRAEASIGYAREVDSKYYPIVQSYRLGLALADPNPATAFNPFASGGVSNPATIAAIASGSQSYSNISSVATAAVKADGTVARIDAGEIKAAIGGEWRRETIAFSQWTDSSGPTPSVAATAGNRTVGGAYAEFLVPVSSGVALPKTDLSLAGRYDKYSDFGSTWNPKLGLSVDAMRGVRLRGGWGTSFKAPALYSVHAAENYQVSPDLNDPRSPTGRTTAIYLAGGNPNLKRQRATTWSAGVDIEPAVAPGLLIEATYFDIDFKDRILVPTVNFANEPLYPSLVRRNPPLAEVLRYLNDPRMTNGLGVDPRSIGAILDSRSNNVASVAENGIDIGASYRFDTRAGEFLLRSSATWILKLQQSQSATSLPISTRNTIGNPLSFRGRAGVTWTLDPLSIGTVVNYSNAYNDVTSVPRQRVDAFTTVDLNLRWTPDASMPGWLRGTNVDLSVVNLFDKAPPFANNATAAVGYDVLNASPLGRFVALQVRKSF